jgi:hypothetical protein
MDEIKGADIKVEKIETSNSIDGVKDDFSDIFVSENDTFDITVKYYKKDGKVYTNSGTDEDFDIHEPSRTIVMTLKYPDQSDCATIAMMSPKMGQEADKIDLRDFLSMELVRVIVLMRKWSIGKKLDREGIMNLNTKIVKGILARTREKIGMEGIL